MSPAGTDDRNIPHPRATGALFGHGEAEQTLLDAYRGGRIPHAWLIGGEAGIGKATLAYRMARFVLAHPDPAAPAVQTAKSLAVPADYPVARRIAEDLLYVARQHIHAPVIQKRVGASERLQVLIGPRRDAERQ